MSKSIKPKITEHTVYQVTEHDGSKHVFATRKEALACVKAIAAPLYRIRAYEDTYSSAQDVAGDCDNVEEMIEQLDRGNASIMTIFNDRSIDGGATWEVFDSISGCWIKSRQDIVDITADYFTHPGRKQPFNIDDIIEN